MKKIVVLGGGISGYGSAILAKKKGFDVFLSDKGRIADRYKAKLDEWQVPYEEGGHTEERILAAHAVVKSPGIPETAPIVRKIRAAGIPVISEMEFAGRYLGRSKCICITGSNGKTTTTSLIYKIMRDAGLNAALVAVGVWAPAPADHLPSVHGMVMVLGFMGTLIALERAQALRQTWAYLAPALLACGGLALVAGAHLLGQRVNQCGGVGRVGKDRRHPGRPHRLRKRRKLCRAWLCQCRPARDHHACGGVAVGAREVAKGIVVRHQDSR